MAVTDVRPTVERLRPRLALRGIPAVYAAYFVEVSPEVYELTADPSIATHGLIDVGDGDWQITPIADLDGSVRMVRTGADTYLPY